MFAGVSLRGGISRAGKVAHGAFFFTRLQNGMNLAQVGSSMQMVLLGMLLILDQFRYRIILSGR